MQIPNFLIEKLYKQYGQEISEKIENGLISKRPVTFRINTLKTCKEEVLKELTENNIKFERVPWYKDALVIKNTDERKLQKLEIYEKGYIYIQSLSSMVPPIVLNPTSGEKVLISVYTDFTKSPF